MTTPSKPQATGKAGTMPPSSESSVLPADSDSELVEDRHAMIADVAFFISESRGFVPGYELEDWLAAEREIGQEIFRADH